MTWFSTKKVHMTRFKKYHNWGYLGWQVFLLQIEEQAFLFWGEEGAHSPQHKDSVQESF